MAMRLLAEGIFISRSLFKATLFGNDQKSLSSSKLLGVNISNGVHAFSLVPSKQLANYKSALTKNYHHYAISLLEKLKSMRPFYPVLPRNDSSRFQLRDKVEKLALSLHK